MTYKLRNVMGWLALAAPLVWTAPASGQGALPEPADLEGVDAAALEEPLDLGPPVLPDSNPAVRTALDLPREEPAHSLRAVLWLIDLGRADLAAPILEELRGQELSQTDLADLVERFGSHRLLQLARTEELAPAGSEFADAAMAAAASVARDPVRLQALVAQLSDPSPEVRHAARVDLGAAGPEGVAAVLESLARETDSNRRASLVATAARLAPLVEGPLLAMLSTQDAALRRDVARLLAHLRVFQAGPLLAAETNSPAAEQALLRAIEEHRQGTPPFIPDADDQIEIWHWDDTAQRLSSTRHPTDEARVLWMARLARTLHRLRPQNRDYYRQALVLGLEAAGLTANPSQPPRAAAPGAGGEAAARSWPASVEEASRAAVTGRPLAEESPALLSDSLRDALTNSYPHAAVALADVLGLVGDAGVLHTGGPQVSPLAAALTHSNRRVRFAALRAIVTLDPTSPFPGSSRVPQALAYFAVSGGERGALVAMPTAARATDLAGQLAGSGLTGQAVNRGVDAVQLARQMPDLELILVDMDILVSDVRQVLYELRIVPSTAGVPIGLLAADGRLEAAQRLAGEHRGVVAFSRPHSSEALVTIVERLIATAGREHLSPAERTAQAEHAMSWIATLLDRDRGFYALQRHAPAVETVLYRTAASDAAIVALAKLATPESQRALVNYASQRMLPIERRRQAAAAFRQSVERSGVLLTTDEILEQYDRYNVSASADAQTQQVLGAVLDSIESRRNALSAAPLER